MSLIDFLEDPVNILSIGVGALSFATLVTLAAPLLKRDTLEVRLKSVANRREELRRRSRQAMNKEQPSSLRQTDGGLYKKVVDRLQLSRLLEDPKVVDRLAEAGFRGPKPVTTFYFFRFVSPFLMAALVGFYVFFVKNFGLAMNIRLCIMFAGFMLLAFEYARHEIRIAATSESGSS